MANIKDSRENMEMFFDSIKKQLNEVMDLVWESKAIKLFLFGDYDFLCKIYGISGANGSYPCLWCLTKKSDIQYNQGPQPERTLESLSHDHQRFMVYGKGAKKNAPCFNNCIHSPMLAIPLDRVTPPYLHCLLGIAIRHHTLLEDAADEIDRMVFTDDVTKTDDVETFKQFGGNFVTVKKKTTKLDFYKTCLAMTNTPDDEKQWKSKVDITETDLAKLGKTDLVKRGGPICSTLDKILNKNRIIPQAYHGRSFIGNHSHKYFKTDVHKQLRRHLMLQTLRCTDNQVIIDTAFTHKAKLDSINLAFSKIHNLISHTDPIHTNKLTNIQQAIEQYMTIYRKNFSQKVLPKHHILEHHCITFIQKYNFGLGLLGEQGGELLHSTIAKIQKRTHAMKNEASQLQTTMKSHLLQTSQHLKALIPEKRKKTTQNKE
ncbi:amine oxidase [Plakobranchus ocellatus]|uniref:Amine oxidase n=1 Tax=Plakobranchus ocellatus TaxID=259542 RepID=A0AAV4B6G5_9GAST|nr:amine oxidase [Plakobranchus ocellatus]